jgi:hypothetical protein
VDEQPLVLPIESVGLDQLVHRAVRLPCDKGCESGAATKVSEYRSLAETMTRQEGRAPSRGAFRGRSFRSSASVLKQRAAAEVDGSVLESIAATPKLNRVAGAKQERFLAFANAGVE